jgi:hypothetical protein
MKIYKALIMLMITAVFVSCGCNRNNNPEKNEQSEVKKPVLSGNNSGSAASNPKMKTDATPGFSNKFERGAKQRESIVDKFDDNGNLIERTDSNFDKNGNISKKNRYTYKYNDRGLRIEQCYYATTADDMPIMSNVNYIKYNEKGQKIENIFISYDQDGNEITWAKNLFKNDNDNHLIQDEGYNKQGIIMNKVVYNYENGMLVSEYFFDFDANGKPINKKTMTYNEFGKVLDSKDEKLK